MRALVAGWFSWPGYGATAGDLMAADVARAWLREAGLDHDVALAPPFEGGVDWQAVDPAAYSHLVFVCGPFRNIGPAITDFLDRFAHCYRVGLDLSMIHLVDTFNPFDLLLERDSDRAVRPDLSLLCRQDQVPVVGLCLVHPQKEYGKRGRHAEVGAAARRLLASREAAVVPIDTRLDENKTGLRTPAEVEAMLARVDVVVTTRLHGTALALKNGVPAVVIDPVAGGAKVKRQADVLGWPVVFTPEELSDDVLRRALDFCLTGEARKLARDCAVRAAAALSEVREQFVTGVAGRAGPRARALVAGWFSWPGYGATAGDLMAADVARAWLREAGLDHDLALAPPFTGGVDWQAVDPAAYSHLVFVCGPCGNGAPLTELLATFRHCYRVGLDLSMLHPVGEWNPFDLLLERDSDRAVRPDISFLCRQPKAPVVGLCLVHRQREYGERGRHAEAGDAARRLLATREAAVVPIDTRLDENAVGLRTPREVESLIARMDLLVTTRLHGTVLALKNGVPAVAIDPVAGGAKVKRQADVLGWPEAFVADELGDVALQQAFDRCLAPAAREAARGSAERAVPRLDDVRRQFLAAVTGPGPIAAGDR